MDESDRNSGTFRELRTVTDLALRTTKAMVQAVGKANLVVLESHLWLNLTEIRDDVEKMLFLDAPFTPKGLFGSAVDSFTKRFTEAQKMAQAQCHGLHQRP